jgi:hypothetical protein
MRSPCEAIRLINDMFQEDTPHDIEVRKLLAEAENKAKQMSIELSDYQPHFHERWFKFPGLEDRMNFRKSPDYKFHSIIGEMR